MIVTAILVSHDGARWLPSVIDGIRSQSRPVDRIVAVDTTSRDGSDELLREAFGPDRVLVVGGSTPYPDAVDHGLEHIGPAAPDEWVWLLHDDSNPDPEALQQLVYAAEEFPEADVLGPKLREWPSLRRLLEVGLTISGTGRRETGLEPGEYDQGQHDEIRTVLAVNTAGMLVRRSVLHELGGFDPELPIFGNDLDFGWRAAEAGHSTLVVPTAVVFHAEAAHRGLRRTPLTGRHTHYQERRAALLTMLANEPRRRLAWQYVRLLLGSLLRALGFLTVRAVGEALDELAAVAQVHGRPGQIAAARRFRAERRSGTPHDVSDLRAAPWVPYRHGLDFVTDLASAATHQAADVAERRRAARAALDPAPAGPRVRARSEEDEDEELLTDSGALVRFLTNPVAVAMTLAVLLTLVAARQAVGSIAGGALSPVPGDVGHWWALYAQSWHPLGSGTDVPAPAYVLPFALAASVLPGGTSTVVSLLMLLAVPFGMWGAWRLLRVVGHLVDPRGLPRWVIAWGALTYALVPATSGAWGSGRFGVVALAALLPWLAHAALGFVDPEPDRRWRAAWRTALLTALAAAFVPGIWLFAALATALVLAAGALIAPTLLRERDSWGPPLLAVAAVPVLLAPWLVPLITSGSGAGLLLEAGGPPGDEVTFTTLVTGRLGEWGAPWWLGAALGLLAVIALVPLRTRVQVLVCWLVGFAAAAVTAALAAVTLDLPSVTMRPGLGLFVVVLSGLAVVATCVGADAFLRRLEGEHPWWQRALAGVLAVIAAAVPLGGLAWWVAGPDTALAGERESVVPAYMVQSSAQGDEHGVLVVTGTPETGVEYRIRRGEGTTVGEDEILLLSSEDRALTEAVRSLTSAPTEQVVEDLASRGIEYVFLAAPADGRVAAGLDATTGLVQASAEDPATRAWRVDRPLDAAAVAGRSSWTRPVLLAVQAAAVVLALVLAAPTMRRRRG